MDTNTWSSDEVFGLLISEWGLKSQENCVTHLQLSLLSPAQVPRILRQTLPSSYRLAINQL